MKMAIKGIAHLILASIFLAGCATQDHIQVRQEAYQAYQDGDYPSAVNKFEKLVQQIPRDAELWFRLGNAYAKAMLPQEAINAYQNALVRDPTLGKAWYNMGMIQMQAALKAYVDMQDHVKTDDPVAEKGKAMRDGLLNLLKADDEQAGQE